MIVNDIRVNEIFQKSIYQKEFKKKKRERELADDRILRNTNMKGLSEGKMLLETANRNVQKVEIKPGFCTITKVKGRESFKK